MGPSLYCDRARMWASLAVDGEISELEGDSLRAHVEVCAACAAYAAELGGVVAAVRAAPLVEPERTLYRPAGSKFTRVRAIQLAASAAAVVAAVGLGHLAASLTSSGGGRAPTRAAIAATQQPYVEHRLLALLVHPPDRSAHGRMLPV